jgi:hypothetical protein
MRKLAALSLLALAIAGGTVAVYSFEKPMPARADCDRC